VQLPILSILFTPNIVSLLVR